MLVHEQQVRLTRREERVLRELTGRDPSGIRTRDDLRRFAEHHLTAEGQDVDAVKRLKDVLVRYLTAL